MWEIKQLKGGQALHLIEGLREPTIDDEDPDALHEEQPELELNEEEAPFLRGQTSKAGMCLEPIKISRLPDGGMQQTAMKQSQFAKDRKDIRELQTRGKKTGNEGQLEASAGHGARAFIKENKK